MTGSGKTGLGIGAPRGGGDRRHPGDRDRPEGRPRQPAAARSPSSRPADFRPWIDEDEARARRAASRMRRGRAGGRSWRKGLAEWGQDGARIARLRAAADVAIYTPGSTRRAAALDPAVASPRRRPPCVEDAEALRERVADHRLGAARAARRRRRSAAAAASTSCSRRILDARLARGPRPRPRRRSSATIQTPPFERVGVLDLETFFPGEGALRARDARSTTCWPRRASRPGCRASRSTSQRLLWTRRGQAARRRSLDRAPRRRRADVLRDAAAQRGARWMRAQPGTSEPARARSTWTRSSATSRRSPTRRRKTPMLTLLKQARAFGLGVVLATQNPVDLDYKGARPTAARGSSAACRPSATRRACSTASRARAAARQAVRPRAAWRRCSPGSASACS